MTDPLRQATIRLAHAHPELRDHLLPMLTASHGDEECPVCGGEGTPLGALGRKQFYRCRDCGMEFSEDGIEPGRGMSASRKTGKLTKRQENILKDRSLLGYTSFDDLPAHVQAALRKVKDQETLWSDVDRWLGDHNNPHLRNGSDEDEDEKEGKYDKDEKVPLDKLPKELQKNVENPPDSVKQVTEKMKAKGQSTNKPPGKSALYQAAVRLAHAKPHLRAHLLPMLTRQANFNSRMRLLGDIAEWIENHVRPGVNATDLARQAIQAIAPERANDRSFLSLIEDTVKMTPGFRGASTAEDEDEKEGKWTEGEDVPLDKLPKELQKNVENPPDSVKQVTEKMKAKGQSTNKPPGKSATTRARAIRLAYDKPELRAVLLPLLKEARQWPKPTEREPSDSELENMTLDSIAEATDGCRVESDGVCRHGHPSWPLYMGMI